MAGEQVTGTIYLNLARQVSGNVLALRIKGSEISRWREAYTHTEGERTETRYRNYNGKNVFYYNEIPLYTWPGSYTMPGQYAFPFAFRLLPNLPSSYNEEN